MDQLTLERLLIDDALEALPPDVHTLLTAYLESTGQHPKQAAWMAVADAARKALPGVDAMEKEISLPSLRVRPNPLWQQLRLGLRAAAMIMIGAGIGMYLSRHAAESIPAQVARPVAAATPQIETSSLGVSDFWSEKRLIAWATQGEPKAEKRNKQSNQNFWPAFQHGSRGGQ